MSNVYVISQYEFKSIYKKKEVCQICGFRVHKNNIIYIEINNNSIPINFNVIFDDMNSKKNKLKICNICMTTYCKQNTYKTVLLRKK